jgi:hypothetical protein
MRRPGANRRGIRGFGGVPAGIVYLLNYADADTFTRATEAANVDPRDPLNGGTADGAWGFVASGAAAWKASGVARIFTDGAVLIEGARENLIKNYADLTGVDWTQINTPTEAVGTTAPDGSASSFLYGDDAAAFEGYQHTLTLAASTAYAYSAYFLKDADTSRYPALRITTNVGGEDYRVYVNTSAGTAVSDAGFDTPDSVTVEDTGDHWRVIVVVTTAAGETDGVALLYPAMSSNGTTSDAGATGTVEAWGMQIEEGAFATSPIRTAGAAATRNLDDMRFAEANVPVAIFSGAFSVNVWPEYASGTDNSPSGTSATVLNSDAVSANRDNVEIRDVAATTGKVVYRSSAATDYATAAFTWAASDKITIEIKHGDTLSSPGVDRGRSPYRKLDRAHPPALRRHLPPGGRVSFANAYVAVRDLHSDGGPDAPEAWGRSVQGTTLWTMIEHPLGLIAAKRINVIGGRGLFSLHGDKAALDSIASGNDEVMPARTAWRRRAVTDAAPGEASPNQIVRAWRTWRCDVWEKDDEGTPIPFASVRRVLSAEGVMLPSTPLPWDLAADGTETTQALAVRRVTVIHRPAMHATLAGHSLHVTFEDEPDEGA